jgi:hypothetical protein
MPIGQYTDDQIKQFITQNANNPGAVAAQAAQMRLNEQQIQDAYKIAGTNYTANDITGAANQLGYSFGANNGAIARTPAPLSSGVTPYAVNTGNVAGYSANGGSNGMSSGTLTTQGGQQVTHDQLSQFAATNPSDQQIMAKAAEWGMSMPDVSTALNSLGLLYNGGNPTSVQMNDPKNGSIYNRLSNEAYRGDNGYGVAANPSGGANTNGQVVAENGHSWVPDGNGGGHWDATGNNTTGFNTPGTFDNPGGSLATNAYNISTGGVANPYATGGAQPVTSNPSVGSGYQALMPTPYSLSSAATTPTPSPATTPTPAPNPTPAPMTPQGATTNVSQGTVDRATSAQSPLVGSLAQTQYSTAGKAAMANAPWAVDPNTPNAENIQKFGTQLAALPVGTPAPFGPSGQLVRSTDGQIVITSPSLSKPYILDMGLPAAARMEQLQALYDTINAPTSG